MQAADYRECGRIDRTQRLTIGNAAASCSSGRPGGCEILLFSDFAAAFLSFPITGTYDRKNEVREDE